MKALLFLFFLLTVCLKSSGVLAKTLEFFIAAVETKWDYVFNDNTDLTANQRKFTSGVQKYVKAVYTEYTDSTFTTQKSKPPWAGIQGPTIRTVANDRVVIHFKNFASKTFSISPIGIPYWKQSEGAGYEDSSSGQETADDAVLPGGYYKYVWDISPNSGPTTSDPDCLTYTYSSQVDIVQDFNSGLIGALLICNADALTEERQQKVPEFILLFAVFDESKSWYQEEGRSDKPKKTSILTQYHTINGYINSTLPGLTVCQKSPVVSWHLIGLGSTPEIHSIQFEGHTLEVMDHRRVTVEMTPMTLTTALMKLSNAGRFLISCKIHSHQTAGMNAFFTVDNCPDLVPARSPDKRNVKHSDDDKEDDEDNMLSTIILKPGGPISVLRSSAKGRPKIWVHYISAEEMDWDFSSQNVDRPSSLSASASEWFRKGLQRLGAVYKKVAFVEYTDKTFTVKKTTDRMLIGPELRGEVGDKFQIIFKNKASRPFNIYPNGLTSVQPLKKIEKDKQVDLRSLAVPPGQIMMYLWKLTAEDGPTEADPQCLTRLYQSMVDPIRDVASGLVGPLIVCKYQSLDKRGRVVTSDKEKKLFFTVFDENRSWYFEENIKRNSEDPTKIDRNDPEFYKYNVMHTVNGFMFNQQQFRMCVGDVILWHVASIGIQSNFLSVYFTGNTFDRDKTYGTVLTLFPMTGDTVTAEVEILGEWEVSAFDPSLKERGMSVRYTVVNCERVLPIVDNDDYDYEFMGFIEKNFPIPRGAMEKNRAIAIRVCRNKILADSAIGQVTISRPSDNERQNRTTVCEIRYILMKRENDLDVSSLGGIPQDILDQLDREMGGKSLQRQKRSHLTSGAYRRRPELPNRIDPETMAHMKTDEITDKRRNLNITNIPSDKAEKYQELDADKHNKTSQINKTTNDLFRIFFPRDKNMSTNVSQLLRDSWEGSGVISEKQTDLKVRNRKEMFSVTKESKVDVNVAKVLSNNEVLEDSGSSDVKMDKMEESLNLLSYNYKDPKKFLPDVDVLGPISNSSDNQTHGKSLSNDYDDYSDEGSVDGMDHNSDESFDIRSTESRFRSYYIAAEEIMWDYGINKPAQLIEHRERRRGMRKYFPAYRKVVFRAYQDKDFKYPMKRGELDKHLGIMGPVLKAEINDILTVVFKNLASRPYSFHLHGVYDKTQGSFVPGMGPEGFKGEDVPGDPVPPGRERVYNWRISKRQGPSASDFDCKAGAYYSNINMEKDINSGLIGPLLICRPGTLDQHVLLQPRVTDFFLLFTTFDERKSWYLDYNIRKFCTPPCQAKVDDPWFAISNKFAAINGYVAETLPGLMVGQYQTARWHLLNVGSQGEFHAVHFHGLPLSVGKGQKHRMGIFNLYPGVFGTVEMRPAIVGTWLIECTIAEHQLAGMRAKLLVYNPSCVQPLGMQSGWISNNQITASDQYGDWKPSLARLELSGSVNAWMGNSKNSWLQVDLLKPMLLHGVQTQGAKTSMGLREFFTVLYSISYSTDQENWTTYRGNSTKSFYTFSGNMDASRIKENRFSPPIMGRYIRINPLTFQKQPTLRIELLGCDLNSCSMPLGMQRGSIPRTSISASSFQDKWLLSWSPDLARLHQEGRANAWRPKTNNPHEWLQVDFMYMKRVTGVVTQGARSVLIQMMVTEFTVSISDDGHKWTSVKEQDTDQVKVFEGNREYDEEALNEFDPPLFTRFIRIHPKGWVNDIALRVEFLGCDTQPMV
ncbi:coagulation factor VIII-like [Myxocyprinus asiaticus]|uniref:coagulation factor VIII-like n=1 Tax=Myxocyprinus asiaticus TaxID=70543 RepID=UPI00222305A4|nr:coagulation factor VIII-like [Myxocyprinus asiaticus]